MNTLDPSPSSFAGFSNRSSEKRTSFYGMVQKKDRIH